MPCLVLKESIRHNEIQKEFTGLTTNSQEGARLDIAANGVWGGTYVRVFDPHAQSNRYTSLQSVYIKCELIKKHVYEQEVEHGTFSLLVVSATGGLAREATTFVKRFTSMLSSKWDQTYSSTLCGYTVA